MFEATDLNLRQKKIEWLIKALLSLVTLFLIVPALTILAVLIYRGSPMISVEFLFGDPTNGMTAGGIFPALAGTIWLVAVSLLVAIPLGISAAIYLSEYAPQNWLTRMINLAIINLAGVPSIVHALFGVGAFVYFFRFGTSILAASLTLAIMSLPIVIVSTLESLQAVPRAFREACWNMGATRWQTIRQTRPAAFSLELSSWSLARQVRQRQSCSREPRCSCPFCPKVFSIKPWRYRYTSTQLPRRSPTYLKPSPTASPSFCSL